MGIIKGTPFRVEGGSHILPPISGSVGSQVLPGLGLKCETPFRVEGGDGRLRVEILPAIGSNGGHYGTRYRV